MELSQYLQIFRRWFWLILLGAALTGGATFFYMAGQPVLYRATAKLLVGSIDQSFELSPTTIDIAMALTRIYAELAQTNEVLEATIDRADLDLTVAEFRQSVAITRQSSVPFLELSVTLEDPELAATAANVFAEEIIRVSPTTPSDETQNIELLVNQEATDLKAQVDTWWVQLAHIDERLDTLSDPAQIALLENERRKLVANITQSLDIIARLPGGTDGAPPRTNALRVVEEAQIPQHPISRSSLTLGIGIMLGAVLGSSAALFLESTDDRIKSSETARELLGVMVAGVIPRVGKRSPTPAERVATSTPTSSIEIESYRALAAHLTLTNKSDNTNVLVITSAKVGEGKSTLTANLGATFAAAGYRTLIIDADLRRPKQHQIFQIEKTTGLTEWLLSRMIVLNREKRLVSGNGAVPLDDAPAVSDESETWTYPIENFVSASGVPNLDIMTGGAKPASAATLFSSTLLEKAFTPLLNAKAYDVILIDTPPCLVVPDSVVIAAKLRADVIMVVEAFRTRQSEAVKAWDTLVKAGVTIRGVVLNKARVTNTLYQYGLYG